MSNTTQHRLDLKVDTSQVRRANKEIREAFSPRTVKSLSTAVGQMTQAVEKMTRAVGHLTGQLKASASAGEGYRRLAADLKTAREEAAKLSQELGRIGGRGGGGGGGRGGFVGGGGFLNSSGNMRGQGRLSGGGGGGAPQAPMPTMSALASTMTGIPFVGAVAAGGLLASASMYGSAVSDATSRRDTHAFLGGSARGKLGVRSRMIGSHIPAGATVSALQNDSTYQSIKRAHLQKSFADLPQYAGDRERMTHWGTQGSPYGRNGQLLPEWRNREAARASGLFVAGGGETEAMTARRNAMIQGRRNRARAAMFSGGASSSDLTAMGQSFGDAPVAARQAASQVSQAMGHRASANQFGFARGAQISLGMGLQTTGSLMRSMGHMSGGSNASSEDRVANMIGTAVAIGLDGSELVEHMAGMESLLKKQTDLGQRNIDMAPMLAMQRRLGSVVDPHMAGRISRDFGSAGARIGMQGSGSQEELLLAQAMGYTGTTESYMQTMMNMQDPSAVSAALPNYLSRFQGSGLSETGRAFFTQRALKGVGVNVHGDTARALGGLAGASEVGGAGVTAADVISAGRGATGGILTTEAGLESRRIEIGYRSAAAVQNLNSTMIALASTAMNTLEPALNKVTGWLNDLAGAADNATSDLSGSGAGGAGGGG